jgi:hypothetical protein
MNKKTSERMHFKKRMRQRFGIELTTSQCKDIADFIKRGKAKFIRRESLRVVIHEMEIQGKLVHVVYDKERQTPVSALLPEWNKK